MNFELCKLMKFYKEGKAISDDDLPHFVVLTGLNGSGKTRGLKQLQNSDPNGTQYIDYRNFAARWDEPTHTSERTQGDIVLQDMIKNWQDPQREHRRHQSLLAPQHPEKNTEKSKFANINSAFFEVFPEASQLPPDAYANLLRISFPIDHPR